MHSRSRDALFIDETASVVTGDLATQRLATVAAQRNSVTDRGIVTVSDDDWARAQAYEYATWMRRGLRARDDRNHDHARAFLQFRPIQGRRYARALEVGCGPFTNMRLLLEHVRVDSITLLDPLINQYLKHPGCTYKRGRLGGLLRGSWGSLVPALRHPWQTLREEAALVLAGGVRGTPVSLIASAIEDYKTDEQFDLIVMINVLEHCRNAEQVFARLRNLAAPGCTLVFHDKLYNPNRLREDLQHAYDVGHPLRVAAQELRGNITNGFTPLLSVEMAISDDDGLPNFGAAGDFYFIGTRIPA